MRKRVFLALLAVVILLPGCSLYDMMFSVLGDHYTGGGTTRFEKQKHYEAEVERWDDYQR